MHELMSVSQLANYPGLAKQTIYNRHATKPRDLPKAVKIRSRLLFDPKDVQEWLETKKCGATSSESSAGQE